MYRFLIAFAFSVFALSNLIDGKVQGQSRDYFIGNSLTDNILTGRALERAAAGTSNPIQTSQHIRCGSSLTRTLVAVEDPSQTGICVATGDSNFDLGEFPNAFQQDIDRLILQPFTGSSFQAELNSTEILIDTFRANPDNATDPVFIYATWGLQENFLSIWNDHVATLEGAFVQSASTYDLLLSELEKDGYEVKVIPAGQAFADLITLLQTTKVGNLADAADLYRDIIHASNAGRYLGALTAYLALSGDSIENVSLDHTVFPFNLNVEAHGLTLNDEAVAGIRQIASQVAPPSVILGDVSRDGEVNFLDIPPFVTILSVGGFQIEADFDRDGVTDFLDISPFVTKLSGQ